MATFLREIQSNGCQYFDALTYSSKDFYSSLEQAIKERNAPDVSFSRVNLSEGGIFSSNREYLRITRKGLSIDVCAAPFARGFFISSWMGEKGSFIADMLTQIPLLGPFFARTQISAKTYFQADSEAMFKMFVAEAIKEVTNKMVGTKATRVAAEPAAQTQS